jgi:hypothetical protein
MRKPRVMPHANKNIVSTSTRSMGRKSAKAMRQPKSQSRSKSSDGTGVFFLFTIAAVWELVIQTGVLG